MALALQAFPTLKHGYLDQLPIKSLNNNILEKNIIMFMPHLDQFRGA